ncbi:MAG: glycosyltransferase family 2 protein [Chryseolinea sp.]
MNSLSVVMISKNGMPVVLDALKSAKNITTDIILMDSGSTDGTQACARELGVKVIDTSWNGFGATRNEGASHASNEFILYLDADEIITPALAKALMSMTFHRDVLYGFRRRNFVGSTEIRHGEWAHDIVYRLHHQSNGKWSLDDVHETIIVDTRKREIINRSLFHYTTGSIEEYALKLERYAGLSAEKYFNQNKSAGPLKPFLAAAFNFTKNYLFRLGLLDGVLGWELAVLHAKYTSAKYKKLRKMYETH